MSAIYLSIAFLVCCSGFFVLAAAVLLISKSKKEDELAATLKVDRLLQELRATAIAKYTQTPPIPPPPSGPAPSRPKNKTNIFALKKGPNDGPGKNHENL